MSIEAFALIPGALLGLLYAARVYVQARRLREKAWADLDRAESMLSTSRAYHDVAKRFDEFARDVANLGVLTEEQRREAGEEAVAAYKRASALKASQAAAEKRKAAKS
jgi:hypothetical protein